MTKVFDINIISSMDDNIRSVVSKACGNKLTSEFCAYAMFYFTKLNQNGENLIDLVRNFILIVPWFSE